MKFFKKLPLFVAGALAAGATNLSAQNLMALHQFSALTPSTNQDGAQPHADLVLSGNVLYGTTPLGGSNGFGTVFSVNTDGTHFTVLHTFTGGPDGTAPNKSLVLSGGTLYGLVGRGTNLVGFGSVFSMGTDGGNFTNFYTFTATANGDLGQPNGGLVLAGDTLYGTAYQGGISNAGTIFSVGTNGALNWVYQFNAGTDGKNPLGTLVVSNDTLYGTTRNGGTNALYGTVFSINTNSSGFTVLHTFGDPLDARTPDAGLTLSGNTLYGTTVFGGTNNGGTVFAIGTDGSGYAVLHSFTGTDGKLPEGGLAQRGNMLYGTTLGNGSSLGGTVFAIGTNGGSFTSLHAFSMANSEFGFTNVDGAQPYSTPVMAGNVLYGTTSQGGPGGMGTAFSLAIVPDITSLQLAATNLVLGGINGVAGSSYALLASTNVALPLNQWTPVATNAVDEGGDFNITATNAVDASLTRRFYRLKAQ